MEEEVNKGIQKAAERYGIFAPQKEEQPKVKEGPVIDYEMKRLFAAGGFLAFCICMLYAAEHGALDNVMEVAGWAILGFLFIGFVSGALKGN